MKGSGETPDCWQGWTFHCADERGVFGQSVPHLQQVCFHILLILVSHLQNIRGMQVNVLEFEFHCCRSRHLGIFSEIVHPVA